MKPVLEWTVTKYGSEAEVGEMLDLLVVPCEVRQEWDWRVDTYDGRLIGEGTDDGRGADAAKLAAESFARQWIAEQAAALGDGWVSCEERLPEHHVEVLVAGVDRGWFQAVGMWHGVAEEVLDYEPGWIIWNRPFTYKPDFVSFWRVLPPLPVVEVKE